MKSFILPKYGLGCANRENLNVNLEEGVVKKIQEMSKNTKISVDELTVIALKRFI